MSDPVTGNAAQPPLPLPPLPRQENHSRGRVGFPLACVTTVCLVLVATVIQNLWENIVPLWVEARQGSGLMPMVALCALALVVALVIIGLLLKRIKRLLISLRMTAAVLLMLALLLSASQLATPDRPAAGLRRTGTGQAAPEPAAAKRAIDDRIMVMVHTVHLDEPGGSWAVIALLGFLAAGSAAGILWRRPLGAREFGFLAVHLGILAILGGTAARHVLGQSMNVKLVPGATATPVPPRFDAEPDFRVRMLQPEIAHRRPVVKLFVTPSAGSAEQVLPIDVYRQGKASWRGLDIAAVEFRESAAPELYVENVPGRSAVPTVKARLTGPQGSQEVILPAGVLLRGASAPLGVVMTYERHFTAQDGEVACRRQEELEPDQLEVVDPEGKTRYQAALPSARSTTGPDFILGNLHLKVLRKFHTRRGAGGLEEAPKSAGTWPTLELAPIGSGADSKAIFRVAAEGQPVKPEGKVPPELAGLQLRYSVTEAPNGARLVEGPEGTFRLVEIEEGLPARAAALPMGGEATLASGIRFKLLEFIPEAQSAYRPAGSPKPGVGRPAVRLEAKAAGEAAPISFWLFPGLSGPREIGGGALLSARAIDRGLDRAAAKIEIIGERGSLGEYALEMGKPLRLLGWQLTLRELVGITESGPFVTANAVVTIARDPAIWAVYIGMALLALGAPWLLWTRFRRVSEAPLRED